MSGELLPPSETRLKGVAFPRGGGVPAHPLSEQVIDVRPPFGGVLDYARLLWRRRWVIGAAAVVGCLFGWLAAQVQDKKFTARATIEFLELNPNVLGTQEFEPAKPAARGNEYIETQMTLLKSPTLVRRALLTMELSRVAPPPAQPGWWSTLKEKWRRQNSPRNITLDEYVGLFAKRLQVRRIGDSNVVELTCEWVDPKLPAEFLNRLAREYMAFTLEKRGNLSTETVKWLAGQLADLRLKLENSERALGEFVNESGLVILDEKGEVAQAKLKDLQAELSKAQADRIAAESRYQLAVSQPATSLPEVLDNGPIVQYSTRLTELRREYAELSQALTPAHYKVKRLQAQIQELEAAIQKERENIVRRIQNEYEAAVRRERLLSEQYRKQVEAVSQQSAKMQRYNLLRAEVESQRALYEAMLQRVKEYQIASGLAGGNVFMIDEAEPPLWPSSPRLPWYLGIGLFGGAFLATGWIVLRAHMETTFDSPGEASRYLRAPELGVIPSAERAKRVLGLSGQPGKERSRLVPVLDGGKRDVGRVWAEVADSFRSALASILFHLSRSGGRAVTLVVTSPGPDEGKTTAAINLAVALAEMHRRVVLLDADFRKPELHDLIGLDNSWGLSDLLLSEGAWPAPPGSSVFDAQANEPLLARESGVRNLYVLPSGPKAPVTDLLYSRRWDPLLAVLGRQFDAIIIDTPPMLNLPDARWIARMADGVVLVVRAGVTPREVAWTARKRLHEDGLPLLGIILNGWSQAKDRYGYPYRGSYYRYSYDSD